jgi:ADP-ribosylglycohydrolase
MIGAIIGDFVGSVYEFKNTHDYGFPLVTAGSEITDDSILTIAIADAILQGKDYGERLYYWGNKFPHPRGAYGKSFYKWFHSPNPKPYNSYGNGSAMRVNPIGWAFDTLEETLAQAKLSAECMHNHPEGIKGAQAVAAAIFLLRNGKDKAFVQQYISTNYYDLNFNLQKLKATYHFDVTCQGTVPPAIKCYLESSNFVDAIRLAVSLGGDSDTLACITGSLAEADPSYQIPEELKKAAMNTVPTELKRIVELFQNACFT